MCLYHAAVHFKIQRYTVQRYKNRFICNVSIYRTQRSRYNFQKFHFRKVAIGICWNTYIAIAQYMQILTGVYKRCMGMCKIKLSL
jgi:hypothetical protein